MRKCGSVVEGFYKHRVAGWRGDRPLIIGEQFLLSL